ncbi:KaiA family protein [Dolichospermum circinale]|uniref:KaiA family protein n=1 Tax=Dolichospermum circinale TaxID=109265 RepID=UPI00048143AA|nr:KaiA family protein [Dolichospermum circinale]MDB9483464.1 KaiA family protein [Dolichospermum circinale CS-537/05]MDB9453276.1 KaiA family protein [Dolichospermum circinale CS-541/06]MDB9462672.1 KaiA family protein [Dolichospermum circinale CS-541/04]MDB9473236.1 KaiA family protein [Dolichospermum circinale CS-537/11]MDB9480715.1 KaiA family protein [Dolichospermum circinale CS-537/03]
MLVPILLLQKNIKQIWGRPFAQKKHKGLLIHRGNFMNKFLSQYYRLISEWYWQPMTTTPDQIYHLPNQTLEKKNNYFLAFAQQRKAQNFQHMTTTEKREILEQLKSDYRQIIVNYFLTDKAIKEKIDKFINALFYANIPVPQIIEIHMEIIDEFAKQLRLEGRSDETLLDYRLTLIDILAHLCEIYRSTVAKIN